jgi:hypothetical protein
MRRGLSQPPHARSPHNGHSLPRGEQAALGVPERQKKHPITLSLRPHSSDRYLDLPEPVRAPAVESPLRILVVIASPTDCLLRLAMLNACEELAGIVLTRFQHRAKPCAASRDSRGAGFCPGGWRLRPV